MEPQKTFAKSEPVAFGAIVYIIVNLILTGLAVWDVASLTSEQTAWVYLAANGVTTIVVALKTRSVVYAPYTVQEAMKPSPEDNPPQ